MGGRCSHVVYVFFTLNHCLVSTRRDLAHPVAVGYVAYTAPARTLFINVLTSNNFEGIRCDYGLDFDARTASSTGTVTYVYELDLGCLDIKQMLLLQA